jgi:hypothetical protein
MTITPAQPSAFSRRYHVTYSPATAGSVKSGIEPGGYSTAKSR